VNKIAELTELSIGFQSRQQTVTTVRQVDFQLNSKETLALLGESGCGKSLTSLAMMRLLPMTAVYGQKSKLCFDEQDLLALPERLMQQLRGKRLAMVFQEPMTALNPVLTIGQQLQEAMGEKNKGLSRAALKEKMIAQLEEVEIPQPELRLRQYPHQLSGGQKQRIVIAMALAGDPEVLIADEPTTALDVTIQAQILQLLKRLQQRHQTSLLFITHDLAVVKAVADRVCVMYAGEIVETADAKAFFNEVKHPYVQELLASFPGFSHRGKKLPVIKGTVPSPDQLPSGCAFHPRCPYAFDKCRQVSPELQEISGREVRCHLYPEQQSLAPVEQGIVEYWKEPTKEQSLLLSVDNLKVHFHHRHGQFHFRKEIIKAVDGVSFQLKQSQTLALVGESGCGKTTLSRALLHLIPVTAGQIIFEDRDVLALKGRALKAYRNKIQLIFQDPFSSMNPRMTVGEIIAEGMVAKGMPAKEIAKRQKQLLNQVHLPENSLSRYPHQFSGGQRQRISIARALATEPKLLICDEPTSALDISVQAQILNLLKELQEEKGLSYLFITHNMGVVAYIADDVMVMKDGQIIESGPCAKVLEKPEHPYTRALLLAVLEI
jgi:peptide/nickel transport system ATP-binding protein